MLRSLADGARQRMLGKTRRLCAGTCCVGALRDSPFTFRPGARAPLIRAAHMRRGPPGAPTKGGRLTPAQPLFRCLLHRVAEALALTNPPRSGDNQRGVYVEGRQPVGRRFGIAVWATVLGEHSWSSIEAMFRFNSGSP